MSTRFAGSRCVDERRRRRLAQESDALGESQGRRTYREDQDTSAADPPVESRREDSPADSLISPKLWKHVLLSVIGLIAWGATIYFGDLADQQRTGLQEIVGLKAGKFGRFFSTIALLTAGQLAFITLWYRSRSRKDFNGSYKLWFWVAITWLTIAAFRANGAHWTLADTLLAGESVGVWQLRTLLWLIPCAIAVVAIYRLLLREVRDCKVSLTLLRCSAIVAMASGINSLAGSFLFDSRVELLIGTGTATLWHLLLALSGLFHARHVVHFSKEPPQSTIRGFQWPSPAGVVSTVRSWLPQGSGETVAGDDGIAADTAEVEKQPASRKRAVSTSSKRCSKQGDATTTAEAAPSPTVPAAHQHDGVTNATGHEESTASETTNSARTPSRSASTMNPPRPHFSMGTASTSRSTEQVVSSGKGKSVAPEDSDDSDADDGDGIEQAGLSKKELRRLRKEGRRKKSLAS
ncbi:MAG: hypothetical protein R3B90_07310 [Planctomycetaceae bacterium]